MLTNGLRFYRQLENVVKLNFAWRERREVAMKRASAYRGFVTDAPGGPMQGRAVKGLDIGPDAPVRFRRPAFPHLFAFLAAIPGYA